jgi:glycosyltransferase involved in cell wall biosynthesis
VKPGLRVLHVITRLIVGGAQENTVSSVLGLRQKPDLSVHLISGLSGGSEGSLESQFTHLPGTLSIVPELVRPIHPWQDRLALSRLTEIFRRERPDIVHTHSGKAGILGRLAAHRAAVPIIIHTIHGPSFGSFQSWLPNCVFRSAERRAARYTDHFISVADAMTEQYIAAGIGRPEQFTRIFSGFDLQPFLSATNDAAVRARFGFTQSDFVVVKLARLARLKGHDDLFAAAPAVISRHPNTKFLLIGDGPLRSQFEARVAALGLQRHFAFTGLVRPDEVPSLLGIGDVLVHLSRREGLPRALPQALAAGKPVVACACDGAPEVCVDGKTGFLIKPDDPKSVIARLTELADDPALRARLGENGREFVRNRFGAVQMVDAIYDLYLSLAGKASLIPR